MYLLSDLFLAGFCTEMLNFIYEKTPKLASIRITPDHLINKDRTSYNVTGVLKVLRHSLDGIFSILMYTFNFKYCRPKYNSMYKGVLGIPTSEFPPKNLDYLSAKLNF
jgi:hypothetical protein